MAANRQTQIVAISEKFYEKLLDEKHLWKVFFNKKFNLLNNFLNFFFLNFLDIEI